MSTKMPVPTGVCSTTNWVQVLNSFPPLAKTASGELWEFFAATPDPQASVHSVGYMLASNLLPSRVAMAICDDPRLFQIHSDGTLWQRGCAPVGWMVIGSTEWKQVGKRSDWVSLWSGSWTAFGLTADGTIWTWGTDVGKEPGSTTGSNLKRLQSAVSRWFGAPTPRGPVPSAVAPVRQNEPRPLLRMISK